MSAFILPLGCHRFGSHARVRFVSVRPMFSSSSFKISTYRLTLSVLPHRFYIMQSDAKQPGVQPSSDEDTPSADATSSTSTTGLAVVEDESKASERSAAWGDTIMHVMLTALAITVSLQARRRVAATLLACLSVPQLLRLGHRLKLIPPSFFPLLPPPESPCTTKSALPAAVEPITSTSSVSDRHLSSIQTAVESLRDTVSSRDMALATTLATLDSNLAAVRDAVQALTPAATPSAPFAHLAEVQVLRARLARAEEARDAVQARLAASETARAESEYSARSANLSLDEALHTIADLRTRLASADVRLARLPDIERRLDDALLHTDSLLEQVRDLTRKCEELSYACNDAERRADRGDSIVDVLRSKIDEITGVRTRSTEGAMSGGTDTSFGKENTGKTEGWQKKLARTVAGLTSESAVLDEMKAMGESAGLADWPVGALSGGEKESPSRADGLPPDGGFAGGAIVAKPEEVARLGSGQSEGVFSFSRNEFEMRRSQQATDSEAPPSTADAQSETPIITPPPDNVISNGDASNTGSSDIDDVSENPKCMSKNEDLADTPTSKALADKAQDASDEDMNGLSQESSSSGNVIASTGNDEAVAEKSGGTETAPIEELSNSRQVPYLQQLEQQSRRLQDSEEPVDEEDDVITGNTDEHVISVEDNNYQNVQEKGPTPVDEGYEGGVGLDENVEFAMEKPGISVEIKPEEDKTNDWSEAGSPKEFQVDEQSRKNEVEISTEETGDSVEDGAVHNEGHDTIDRNRRKLDRGGRAQSVDEASVEEDVGEWRSVSGESEYPFHENVTDNEDEFKSVDEVIRDAENLIRRGRRRGLALVDADRLFRQAYTKLDNILERADIDVPDRSKIEGALGNCLVAWVKINVADGEARPRLVRAFSLLESRIEQAEDDATALFNAGLCLCLFAATGKIDDARECYERACEFYEKLLLVEPQSRIGFYNCGLAYISLGRIAASAGDDIQLCKDIMRKAVAMFEKSLELKPGDEKALSYLDESRKQLVKLQE